MGKLNELAVKRAKAGKYGDGGGLQLSVSPSGAKKWVLRFLWRGTPREMGLGSYPEVTLAAARDKAIEGRRKARDGIDPIAEGRKDKGIPTFGELADEVAGDLAKEWRNEKHKAQWRMTLTVYAAPLRDKPVDTIETADVLTVLQPLWQSRPETASRVRGRIERVLNAAKAKGFRTGENPAAWRGHLDHLLPKRSHLSRGHHAAMDYKSVSAFIADLRQRDAIAARALEFTILTAARSGEVLGALWSEIDLDAKIWTIPAERMKAGREHRVPFSGRAVEILREVSRARNSPYVWPGQLAGKPLSSTSLEMLLRRMGIEDATVHGFRSTFRDWAGEETHFARELAEHALAHAMGDRTEQAYRRGNALEKRRALMEAWAAYCEPRPAASNVVPLRA